MKKKYLLPSLTDTPEINSQDKWKKEDAPYKFLLEHLKLYFDPAESIFEGGSSAMPHVFEQMLLFHKAFLDVKNPEHTRAVLEWRVVLMILALQRIRNLRVDFKRVDLSMESSNNFLRAAASMISEETVDFFNTTWDFLYVIILDGVPIAITSPVTLICPAKQMMKKLQKIDWFSIEKINGKDTLLTPKLTAMEHGKLYGWLERLKGNVAFHQIHNENEDFGVKKELLDFMNESKASGNLSEKDLIDQDIYSEINGCNRKEYNFLNFCCKLNLTNPKMRFLLNWYQNDIFLEKLPVVLYNSAPDAMKKDNVEKLDSQFSHVFKINGNSIIEVKEQSGIRVAALALLPFADDFVKALYRNRITPDELFGSVSIIYERNQNIIELSIKFKGFSQVFTKKFSETDWAKIYADQIASVYLWPPKQIAGLEWRHYYAFSLYNNMEISVPDKGRVLKDKSVGDNNEKMRLIQTEDFPMYLKYTLNSAIGYLPVQTEMCTVNSAGGKLLVYVDTGHTTTCVYMLNDKGNRIAFRTPGSLRVSGNLKDKAGYYFLPEDGDNVAYSWFRNIINVFDHPDPTIAHIMPFRDGTVIFQQEQYEHLANIKGINFLQFEYETMEADEREHVHLMLEQILLFAVYHAIQNQCSYIQLNFLHNYPDNDAKFGELKGLWSNAVDWVRGWTGIKKIGYEPLLGLNEIEALAYATYFEVMKENAKGLTKIPDGLICIGVDIGWKKTELVFLMSPEGQKDVSDIAPEGQNDVIADYMEIQYAGEDISGVKKAADFSEYPSLLNILLNGTYEFSGDTAGGLLERFGKYCTGTPAVSFEEAVGLFDLIAMRIEKANFRVPPDVYNNMPEFRLFINMYTYNILLLFMNIGYLLKKERENRKEIRLYLSGNGVKFLKWISNDKSFQEIDDSNAKEILIPKLENSILDVIKTFCDAKDGINISVKLVENGKEQLLRGFSFKKNPGLGNLSGPLPEIQCKKKNNVLDEGDVDQWNQHMENLCQDIFGNDIYIGKIKGGKGTTEEKNITERIKMNSLSVEEAVIKKINSIRK